MWTSIKQTTMKNDILFFLFLSLVTTSFAQQNPEIDGKKRTTIQRQQMDRGYYYCLDKIGSERNYNTQYELLFFGKTDTVLFKTNLNKHVYSIGNPITMLYIHFISVNTGFVYGYESGYGEFPMLYKTTDGGKTWNRRLFKEQESLCSINEDNFHMFNQKQGIMIVNPSFYIADEKKYNEQHFDYFITNDGGLTWKKKKVDLTSYNIYVHNREHNDYAYYTSEWMKNMYKKEGTIVSIISNKNKTIVLCSDDFGESFRVLK